MGCKSVNSFWCGVGVCDLEKETTRILLKGDVIMKKLVFMLALLIAPISISTAFAGSCGGGDHTHTDEKKETK